MLQRFTLPLLGVSVSSYRACLVLAIVVGIAAGVHTLRRWAGYDLGVVFRAQLWGSAAALVGGHAHYLLNAPGSRSDPLAWLRVWEGIHAGGALAGLAVALPFIARHYRLSPARFADAIAPPSALALAVLRVGCLLNGCCFGTRCSYAWCITFPPGSSAHFVHQGAGWIQPWAPRSEPVHPLQIYFLVAALGAAALGVVVHRHQRVDGVAALATLLAWAVSSFALEFLRESYPGRAYWGSLPQLAWSALGIAVVTSLALAVVLRAHALPRVEAVRA
jgi:phosphatidylglycerol:prolipoprotein diacylglycerol transferase